MRIFQSVVDGCNLVRSDDGKHFSTNDSAQIMPSLAVQTEKLQDSIRKGTLLAAKKQTRSQLKKKCSRKSFEKKT